MRTPSLLPLGLTLGACAALTACEPVFLDALLADLTITPASTSRVAWVGYPSTVPFVLSNSSRVGLELQAPLLQGATAQLGASLLNAPASVESAQSATLEVALAPMLDSDGVALELTLLVTPVDGEVAPVSASLAVEVRAPPPCAPRDPCETAAFDPVLGECVRTAHQDGESCSDDSLCTEDDRCSSGVCVGRAVTCGDLVDCTLDTCDPDRGCVFEPLHSRCEDDNPCTADACLADRGCARTVVDDGTPCGPFSCQQLETCFYGACVAAPTPDGFPCEDGDLCTAGDTCLSQACVSGALVEPAAQAPTLVARPTIHVSEELRWYQDEHLTTQPIDVPAQADFDTTLRFGEALDLAQGLVGFRPTLAVLWKSEPFGIDGISCAPWDMWGWTRDSYDPGFCATAVVATLFDEGELSRGEGGTSIVLGLAYGTVDASFSRSADVLTIDDGPPGDTLELVMVESTYFPRPDPGREIFLERIGLSLATRSIIGRAREAHYSGPSWQVETNVHAGIRVADEDGEPALVGWDLPRWPYQPDGPDGDSADRESGEADNGAAAMPWMEVTLDRGIITAPTTTDSFGQVQWTPMLYDECSSIPLPNEDLAFRDVEVFHYEGEPWTLLRSDMNGGYGNGCGEYVEPTSASLFMNSPFTDEVPWVALGDDVLSVSITGRAESLALVRPFACIDALGDCPSFALSVMTPPLGVLDPVVSAWTVPFGDYTTAHARAVALEPHFGANGAVLVERDLLGLGRVKLVDGIDTDDPLILATELFAIAERPARALRSPLSSQSVYAVVAQKADPGDLSVETVAEGAVVRFGCPFPTFPSVVTP